MNDDLEIQNALQSLPAIETFQPGSLGSELLRQIDESVAEVNAARDRNAGLSPEVVSRIEQQFLADRVRCSATIEGSTLDRRETLHVLTTGQLIEGKSRPSEEIVNIGKSLNHAGSLLHIPKIRETDIRDLHSLLMQGLISEAGRYRPLNVKITNATYRPPEHFDVPRLMAELVEIIGRQEASGTVPRFLLGVYVHWAIARIHPFVDGNGRMARVLQDLFFLRHRLVPTPIPFQQVDDYYESLQKADAGNPVPFVEFVANATLKSLQRYKAAIDDARTAVDWIDELVAIADASVKATEQVQYLQYSQRIGELRETMRRVFESLAGRIPELKVRFRTFSGIDLSQYRSLKAQGRASRTWDFGVDVGYQNLSARFVFWHGVLPAELTRDLQPSMAPVLLISIEDGTSYRSLIETGDERISLRAIGVPMHSTGLVRVRYNPVRETNEVDEGKTASEIAREFTLEALRSRLGIG